MNSKWWKVVQSGFSQKEVRRMFIGEYEHTIDPKSRIIMPAKFREGLGEKFVITKSFTDNCLVAYSEEEWANFENKLKTLPTTDKDALRFIRAFFSAAIECEIDKQGRILISSKLKEYAKLEKDVIIIGALTKVEIWSKEVWEGYSNDDGISSDEVAEKLAALGI